MSMDFDLIEGLTEDQVVELYDDVGFGKDLLSYGPSDFCTYKDLGDKLCTDKYRQDVICDCLCHPSGMRTIKYIKDSYGNLAIGNTCGSLCCSSCTGPVDYKVTGWAHWWPGGDHRFGFEFIYSPSECGKPSGGGSGGSGGTSPVDTPSGGRW